ncbi:HNH endonuclease [Nocardioides panacis]|uniref:HNH endonuclease n=1 Tax=Nocardioides panacis TaxID=2849501 RepID=A0A975T091_9ACTN|nr:HNH endonuclease [Nocardioides panacis]QWZ09238.1 HNH endonuclease [Nocardioides panacis]
MLEEQFSRLIRESAMTWLDARPREQVDYAWLSTFEYEGQRIPLMDRQRGIRKPASMNAALSMRTVFTKPGDTPPYADAEGKDGLQRYKYRGDDPQHSENRALRRAHEDGLPLIWFVGIAASLYQPIYPVWIVGDELQDLQFALALDEGQRLITPGTSVSEDTKRYVERTTRARLHQPMFRARVLSAYKSRCAVCQLGHVQLLDAAHIISDSKPHGDPVVPNGLAMCKIHHAAFDSNILGVRPDLSVHIRQDILDEIDGPMLRHGLQGMHNQKLTPPLVRLAQPDPGRLDERYSEFLAH